MFKPQDPLKPREATFEEAWQAQTLALADTMVQAGVFSANDWATTLGAALAEAEACQKPDTTETYYSCAIQALEQLVAESTTIGQGDLAARKDVWTRAYLATPHGQPVSLQASLNQPTTPPTD